MLDILTGRGAGAAPRPVAPPTRPEPVARDDAFAPTLAGALRSAPRPRPVAPRDAATDRARSDAMADVQARIRGADVRSLPERLDDLRSLPERLDDERVVPESMSPIAALPEPDAISLPAVPDDETPAEPPAEQRPIAPYVMGAQPLPLPMAPIAADSSMPITAGDDANAPGGQATSRDERGSTNTLVAATIGSVTPPPLAGTTPVAASTGEASRAASSTRSAALAVAADATAAREDAVATDVTKTDGIARDAHTEPTHVHGPARIVRDLSGLDPEFRAKLERVIARMEREHGHDVTVTETVRSQARQDALYAQGRTTEGPIVTWTRHSKHARGLAADLLIDGTYDNAVGYARLARIAKEEGLRTLGAKDPGHVELAGRGAPSAMLAAPSSAAGEAIAAQALEALAESASRNGHAADAHASPDARARVAHVHAPVTTSPDQLARVADVAQVARVARPADVARVAEVAEPFRVTRERGDATTPQPAIAAVAPITDAAPAASVDAPRAAAGVEQMERVARLLDLQATQGARPLNGVLLRMDRGAGVEDVIRVGMRGTSVEASLGIGDPLQAAAMSGRVNELRAALERRGLAADGLTVQATRATDRIELTNAIAATPDVQALRALADAALQQQAGGRDSDAQRRAMQQDHSPSAQPREERKPTHDRASDDARRQPRREAQEDRR